MSAKELLADLLLLSHAARQVLQDEVLEEFEEQALNATRASMMALLARQGPQSINALAEFLGLSKAAASQNVDVLCRRGFGLRRDDKIDRRTTWVELTKLGRSTLELAERRQRERMRKALAGLPPQVEERAGKVLQELALSLLSISHASETTCLQCCAYKSAGCIKESNGWSCRFLANSCARSEGAPNRVE
jgi:DNA-binding MarR family transcriptional regulator